MLLRVTLSLLFVFGSVRAESISAGGLIESIEFRPYLPTDQDQLLVVACGTAFGYVVDGTASASVDGWTIDMDARLYTYPATVYSDWCLQAATGPLPAGDYVVSVHLSVDGTPRGTQQRGLTVAAGRFCWTDATTITSNQVSDSYPSPVVFEDRLYLFWNKTYDGEVVYSSYDGADWTGAVPIADASTPSAIAAAVYGGEIHVAYSKEDFHLYHRSSPDGVTWSPEAQLTFGSVYDTYGAAAVVHAGRLHIFWKRWQTDGYRHIYSKTYDGAWGPESELWTDEYLNTPVSAASFQDRLFVFYRGGSLYRVHDGSSWSAESPTTGIPLIAGSDGASPASVVVSDRLVLVVVSADSRLYQLAFDGQTWSESRLSQASEAPYTMLNLGAALFRGSVHLFWGGIYSYPDGELHQTLLVDSDGDGVGDSCDRCPAVADPQQLDQDDDGHGVACDCDDGEPNTHPGALEINDGSDNQCPGENGYGLSDEISGASGFLDPADRSAFCWPLQGGATLYETKRSDCAFMCSTCASFVAGGNCWYDPAQPLAGSSFHYLTRAIAPNVGSWGHDSSGVERTVCP